MPFVKGHTHSQKTRKLIGIKGLGREPSNKGDGLKNAKLYEKQLKELYSEKILSTIECGKILNVTPATICRWLRLLEIPLRSRGEGLKKSWANPNKHKSIKNKYNDWEDKLRDLIENQRKSQSECAEIFKCTKGHIGTLIKKFGITKLSRSEARAEYDINKNVLYDLYHNQKMSKRDIGKKYNWSQTVVQRLMEKYYINTRTDDECNKLKGEKLKGNTHCLGRIPWNKDKEGCFSEETINKMSDSTAAFYVNNPEELKRFQTMNIGRKMTDEEKQQKRLSFIKRTEEQIGEGGQMFPFYNSTACEYFKWIDENIFESSGQYATNGGEYYIKELGYWVDYYNPEIKVIIEWDEESHYKNDELSVKDKTRQKEIESVFPDYDFIRIRESQLNYFMLCLLVGMRYKNDSIRKA